VRLPSGTYVAQSATAHSSLETREHSAAISWAKHGRTQIAQIVTH
jgi:hypothetical protein